MSTATGDRRGGDRHGPVLRGVCLAVFTATMAQLLAAVVLPGAEQFSGKAFGARAVLYPLLMWTAPAVWWARHRRGARTQAGRAEAGGTGTPTGGAEAAPWGAFTLVMLPFLVDVTGNTLDLYDRVPWFDDACHFGNWALLMGGLGLLLDRRGRAPAGLRALAIAGTGALLAVVWELGEWATFMRFGTELDGAYTDTLGDLALGTLGGCVAAAAVTLHARRTRGRA